MGHLKFVILSGPRTGSTMLVSALNSSPEIVCFGELFQFTETSVKFGIDGYDDGSPEDLELRNRDFLEFLNQRIFVDREGVTAVGFKHHYGHFVGFPGLREWMYEHHDIRVLHLRRRNLLRMLLSTEIAQATGGWVQARPPELGDTLRPSIWLRALRHPARYAARLAALLSRKKPEWKTKREPMTLSVEACKEFFQKSALHAEFYDKLFAEHRVRTLYYEDLVAARQATLDSVQQFLEVTPRSLGVSTARQNPEPLEELIANHDELLVAFQGTDYEAFLD